MEALSLRYQRLRKWVSVTKPRFLDPVMSAGPLSTVKSCFTKGSKVHRRFHKAQTDCCTSHVVRDLEETGRQLPRSAERSRVPEPETPGQSWNRAGQWGVSAAPSPQPRTTPFSSGMTYSGFSGALGQFLGPESSSEQLPGLPGRTSRWPLVGGAFGALPKALLAAAQ